MPFTKERAAVVYVRVKNVVCVTLDYMQPLTEKDPMLVRDGSACDDHKVSSAGVKRRSCWKHFCSSGAPGAVAFLLVVSQTS